MKARFFLSIVILALFLSFSSKANATLFDYGNTGQYFFDDITNLYWYDPIEFSGWTRLQVDQFIIVNSNWEYGSLTDIKNFVSNYGVSNPQTDVLSAYLGDPSAVFISSTYEIRQWRGYFSSTGPEVFGGPSTNDGYGFKSFVGYG